MCPDQTGTPVRSSVGETWRSVGTPLPSRDPWVSADGVSSTPGRRRSSRPGELRRPRLAGLPRAPNHVGDYPCSAGVPYSCHPQGRGTGPEVRPYTSKGFGCDLPWGTYTTPDPGSSPVTSVRHPTGGLRVERTCGVGEGVRTRTFTRAPPKSVVSPGNKVTAFDRFKL